MNIPQSGLDPQIVKQQTRGLNGMRSGAEIQMDQLEMNEVQAVSTGHCF